VVPENSKHRFLVVVCEQFIEEYPVPVEQVIFLKIPFRVIGVPYITGEVYFMPPVVIDQVTGKQYNICILAGFFQQFIECGIVVVEMLFIKTIWVFLF